MRFEQPATGNLGVRNRDRRFKNDQDREGSRDLARKAGRRSSRRGPVTMLGVEKQRSSTDLWGIITAPQQGQLFIKAAEPMPNLGGAAHDGSLGQVELGQGLGVLVRLRLAFEPSQATQRAVRGLQPGRGLGQQEAVRLQIRILPDFLAEKCQGRRDPLPRLRLESFQFQGFPTQVVR